MIQPNFYILSEADPGLPPGKSTSFKCTDKLDWTLEGVIEHRFDRRATQIPLQFVQLQ